MIQSAFNFHPNLPGTVIGGVPAMGLAGAPLVAGAFDADPISPGVQTQRGILTATGPSRIVPGTMPGMLGGDMFSSGVGVPAGFGSGYGVGFRTSGMGMVDADPITPGIQSQPGIVTPVGPPRIVGGPGFVAANMGMGMMGASMRGSGLMTSGYRNVGVEGVNTTFGGVIGGGFIDADPITPGIQSQPGILTSVGPPVVLGAGAVGGALSNALSGTMLASGLRRSGVIAVDADPVTPGFQAQPGIVRPVGPTQIVGSTVGYGSGVYGTPGYIANRGWFACCPWWLWVVLALLLLGGIIGGLFALNQDSQRRRENRVKVITTSTQEAESNDDEGEMDVSGSREEPEDLDVGKVDSEDDIQPENRKSIVRTGETSGNKRQKTTTTSSTTTTAATTGAASTSATMKPETEVPSVPSPNETVSMENSDKTNIPTSPISSADQNQTLQSIPPQSETQQPAESMSTPDTVNSNSVSPSATAVQPAEQPKAIPQPQPNTQSGLTSPSPPSSIPSTSSSSEAKTQTKSSGNSSSTESVKRNRKKIRYLKRTVTKTTFENQIVDPIFSEPKYKHKHLTRAAHVLDGNQ